MRYNFDLDYGALRGSSEEEFMAIRERYYYPTFGTRSFDVVNISEPTKEKIEKLLEVAPGTLKVMDDIIEKYACKCGHEFTTYDAVFTGLVDVRHSKSFLLHTILGSKFIITPANRIRCSHCGTLSDRPLGYAGHHYEWDLDDPKMASTL